MEAFYEALLPIMIAKAKNSGLVFKEKYNKIIECLKKLDKDKEETESSLRKKWIHSQVTAWQKKYLSYGPSLITIATLVMLVV